MTLLLERHNRRNTLIRFEEKELGLRTWKKERRLPAFTFKCHLFRQRSRYPPGSSWQLRWESGFWGALCPAHLIKSEFSHQEGGHRKPAEQARCFQVSDILTPAPRWAWVVFFYFAFPFQIIVLFSTQWARSIPRKMIFTVWERRGVWSSVCCFTVCHRVLP